MKDLLQIDEQGAKGGGVLTSLCTDSINLSQADLSLQVVNSFEESLHVNTKVPFATLK